MYSIIKKHIKERIVEYDNIVLYSESVVSIMVITYNHKAFIKECLDGILMQDTNFQFEILLGDDDSTDGTREICIEYADKYPNKIRLFLHHRKNNIKINGNPTGRLNFLHNLYNARGKYIALCEGDDYWTDPLKLQKQVDFLEKNPGYNICFHRVQIFNQDGNKLGEDSITEEVPETTNIENLARGNYIHTPSILLRNNFTIPKWFSKCPIGDWTLYMIAIKDKKIKKLDETMAVYRVHDQGIWAKNSEEYRIGLTRQTVKLVLKYLRTNYNVKTILGNRLGIKIQKHSPVIRFLKKIKNSLKQ